MSKENEFAIKLLNKVNELFNEEDEHYIEDSDLAKYTTEFIHAISSLMPNIVYGMLTGYELNLLEFNHLANKLIFQFLKVNNETKI